MKVAVVDDEKIWREEVLQRLEPYFSDMQVTIDVFSSGNELLEKEDYYEVLFLDIEMPEMDGFETASRYREIYPDALIIILTTHTEMSRKGYLINAFRYLDKTLLDEELEEAINSAKRCLGRNRTILIRVINQGEMQVALKDIMYIETAKRNVLLHTRDNTYRCSEAIGEVEKLLDEEMFFRCHKSFIVNLDAIKSFDRIYVYLMNQSKIFVSARKYSELKMRYLENKIMCANS